MSSKRQYLFTDDQGVYASEHYLGAADLRI